MSEELSKIKFRIGDRSPKKGAELIRLAQQISQHANHLGISDLARKLEISQDIVRRFLKLYRAPDWFKQLVIIADLGFRAAYKILELKNAQSQRELLELSAELGLTEPEILAAISEHKSSGDPIPVCVHRTAKPRPKHLVLFTLDPKLMQELKSKFPESDLQQILIELLESQTGIGIRARLTQEGLVAVLDPGTRSRLEKQAILRGIQIFDLLGALVEEKLRS